MRAKPRASRSQVIGVRSSPTGDVLDVRLAAPPVDGAANAELLATLSRALGVPGRDLALDRGASSRMKRVRVAGLTPAEVLARLAAPAPG